MYSVCILATVSQTLFHIIHVVVFCYSVQETHQRPEDPMNSANLTCKIKHGV